MAPLVNRLFRLIASSLCLAGALPARADEAITWAVYDLPPSYVLGPNPTLATLGNGIADRLLAMIAAAMPDYRHKLVLMPLNRILAEFQAGRDLCTVNAMLTPERARIAYSTPLLLVPTVQVVFNRGALARHPEMNDGVHLADLVSNPSLRGQFASGRSYGPTLDAIIGSPANVGLQANRLVDGEKALRMVALGRADYTIEYPALVRYLTRHVAQTQDIASVPLLDADQVLEGHVLCSRTPWGERVIRRIDDVLPRLAAKPAYRQAVENWLPRDELQRHRADYDAFYRKRASQRFCNPGCP